ncbi:MAG: autorepressor SdpR family transcription factor [Candidatus Saccharimonadales bacterium]
MAITTTLKTIADPVRRDILEMLKSGKKNAGEISKAFNLTGATVSYHLAQLKKANLVSETKVKNYVYYELNVSVLEELLTWVYGFGGKENAKK